MYLKAIFDDFRAIFYRNGLNYSAHMDANV